MKTILLKVIPTLLFSIIVASTSFAQCINNQFTTAGLSEDDFGQSFTTAGTSCGNQLDGIVLQRMIISSGNDGVATATVSIFLGETVSGMPQYTQSGITISAGAGDKTIMFSGGTGNLTMLTNTTYTFYIQLSQVTDWRVGQNNVGEAYSGGRLYGLGSFTILENYDLDMRLITSGTLLPVELTGFQGKAKENHNHLTWITASETNNRGFLLEHSTDGRDFQEIAWIEGNGTTIEESQYDYLHKNPESSINYYRLLQEDHDGNTEYSEVIHIDNKGKKIKELSATFFPNPSRGKIQLKFFTQESGELSLRISNANGKEVRNISLDTEEGENNLPLDLSDLPKGIYFIKMEQNAKTGFERLIIK